MSSKGTQLLFDFDDKTLHENQNILYVFSTNRQVREFCVSLGTSEPVLLPKVVSIAELLKRSLYVPSKKLADESERLLVMKQACARVSLANEVLNIPTEFFAFLKNSEYLFSFFRELASHKIEPLLLNYSDTYANFLEHITLLDAVLKEYLNLLKQKGIYDDISICYDYEINSNFITSFDKIIIEIDGFLSKWEWEILFNFTKFSNIFIKFSVSKFNKKFIDEIRVLLDKEQNLKENYFYELDLNNRKLFEISALKNNTKVYTRGFEIASLQVGYIFEKVSGFISQGIPNNQIAVILADESLSELIYLYDGYISKDRIFSLAMGLPFSKSRFYIALSTIVKAIDESHNVVFGNEYANCKVVDLISSELCYFGVDIDLFSKFRSCYNEVVDFKYFCDVIYELSDICGSTQTVKEELFFMQVLNESGSMSFNQMCHLLLLRLKNLKIDDVGGGDIRVLGLLESRGLKFKAVVIAGFNDDVVPHRVLNDMYLSSSVRSHAGLISYSDRENLQRFYYQRLIAEADYVAISYVENAQFMRSRFLYELKTISDAEYSDDDYVRIFGEPNPIYKDEFKPNIVHDFFENSLSFTRLDSFLKCPRLYYYRYVACLGDERALGTTGANEYGNKLHEFLKNYYLDHVKSSVFNVEDFIKFIRSSDLLPLEKEVLSLRAYQYAKNIEDNHFLEGWRVMACELNLENVVFDGIKMSGHIDRVDKNNSSFYVIDYKSGSVDEKSLQLPFYVALLKGANIIDDFSDVSMAYYSFKDMNVIFPKTNLDDLKDAFSSVKNYFSNNPRYEANPKDSNTCRYCIYRSICKGEIL